MQFGAARFVDIHLTIVLVTRMNAHCRVTGQTSDRHVLLPTSEYAAVAASYCREDSSRSRMIVSPTVVESAAPSAWWMTGTAACYHEPKVHDHSLYHDLAALNLTLVLPLAAAGLVFNVVALLCLSVPPKITSGAFVFLKALLILDNCHILASSASILLPQLCDHHHSTHHAFYRFCMFERRFLKYTLPRIENTVNLLHAWTIASLSVHRYWKVSRPVVSRFKDTASRARCVLFVLFAVGLLFRLPIFGFELELRQSPTLRIVRRPETTEMLSPYRVFYHTFASPMATNIIPFLLMSAFSFGTLIVIFRSRHFAYAQFASEPSSSFKRLNYARGALRRTSTSTDRSIVLTGGSVDLPMPPPTATAATLPASAKNSLNFTQPLAYLRRRADSIRQRQELRATVSIVLIILMYLFLHSLEVYNVVRKWQLLLLGMCPSRTDYIQSHIATMLSLLSASVNAFIFIAITNRIRHYFRALMRKTSRLSTASEPSISPRGANCVMDAMLA